MRASRLVTDGKRVVQAWVVPCGSSICLSKDEAAAMLPPGDQLEIVVNPGRVFITAWWSRVDVLRQILRCMPEVAGDRARADGFDLVLFEEGVPMFVRTRIERVAHEYR